MQMSKDDMKELRDMIEKIKGMKIDEEELAKLSTDDRTFVMIHTGMVYNNGINAIDRSIMEMQKLVRTLVPETPDLLKILIARLEDIDPSKIDELSAGFIAATFKIDDKDLKITTPEVGEFDKLEYKRFIIKQIKVCDEQAAVAVEYRKELKDRFDREIPEDVKNLLSDMIKCDQWVIDYFSRKVEDESLPDSVREEYKKKLQYKQYAFTLEPIINNLKNQINKSGAMSIKEGFFNYRERYLKAALNIAHKKGFSFPFQMISGLDDKLFKEGTYHVKYRNLFIFILARYIRYLGDKITEYDKLFFASLLANLVLLNRSDGIEKYPDIADKMRESIGTCMNLIVR